MLLSLTQEQAKTVFTKLYGAKNANEIAKIIEKDEFLSHPNNWKPFNDTVQNFASFQNQSADPLSAAVEKQNNQYDAMLEKLCIQHGIDPKSPEAPNSVKEAVLMFLGIDMNNWHAVDEATLRNFAEDIQIIADGDKITPNLTFYDYGIGQEPENFERTFLSINAGNKSKKRFLQGKFNMGGLGAQEFCAGGRYQLIASKSALNPSSQFGFTLVRFHELTKEEEQTHRSPWYEYFCPNDEIPAFDMETLDLGLENRDFTTGTVIKLYSYELTEGMGGDFLDKFYKELNQAMFLPPMPLLISERRYKPNRIKKGMHNVVFLGNHNRIQQQAKDVENQFAFTLQVEPYGDLHITGYVLKEGISYTEYGGNKPVILTLNGQSQGTRERAFISQELGFKYLRDSLIVHVDCSDSRRNYDIFMGSRDRTKRNRTMLNLWEKLTDSLKNEATLQEVNAARLDKRSPANPDNGILIEKIWRSVSVSERLTSLLKKGGYGVSHQHKGVANQATDTSTRQQLIVPLSEGEGVLVKKSIPLGATGHIHFHPEHPAWKHAQEVNFQVKLLQHRTVSQEEELPTIIRSEELFDIKKKQDGDLLKVSLKTLQEQLKVGDEALLSVELSFDNITLSALVDVNITSRVNITPPKKKNHSVTPELLCVYEAQGEGDASWEDYGWTEEDVLQINVDSDGIVRSIAVNMDASPLQHQLLEKKHSDEDIEEAKFLYMTNIYFNGLYMYLSLLNTKSENENFDVEERTASMFKSTFGEFLTSYNANALFEV